LKQEAPCKKIIINIMSETNLPLPTPEVASSNSPSSSSGSGSGRRRHHRGQRAPRAGGKKGTGNRISSTTIPKQVREAVFLSQEAFQDWIRQKWAWFRQNEGKNPIPAWWLSRFGSNPEMRLHAFRRYVCDIVFEARSICNANGRVWPNVANTMIDYTEVIAAPTQQQAADGTKKEVDSLDNSGENGDDTVLQTEGDIGGEQQDIPERSPVV
jgi:hypothetical protein